MKFILLNGLVLLFFTACHSYSSSSPTDNKNTSGHYGFKKINAYVRYVARQRQLQADMTFRTDSTKAIDGLVVLNDELMQFKKRPKVGLQYILEKQGVNFDRQQTFAYVEKDGSQQELSITLPAFDSLKVASNGISHAQGGVLSWKGAVLDKNDGMVLLLTDANGQTFSINHVGATQGNYYPISAAYAQKMALGTATLEATRKRTQIKKEGEGIQLLTIEYYHLPVSFEVTK